MALLWQKKVSDNIYQVRSAGHAIRLYTNGILHTQYNPKQIVTGGVWDLLLLGAFLVPRDLLKRALVLGVGGGAVLHQIENYFPQTKITGIELNPVHIQIAKEFFKIDHNCELVQADAISWARNYDGPKYDLVIDDVYSEVDGEPDRVQEADLAWIKNLESLLSPNGSAVLNFVDAESFKSASESFKSLGFQSAFRFTTRNCYNIIGIYCRHQMTSKGLLETLRVYPELDTRRKTCRLNYSVRKIF